MPPIFSPSDLQEMRDAAEAIGKAAEKSLAKPFLVGGSTLVAQAQ